MSRDFTDCGWAKAFKDASFFCTKKKWRLTNADKGTGLCPCQFWVKKLEKKSKKTEKPPKTLF